MTSSTTIIVFALSFCISQAVNQININGDIYYYEGSSAQRIFESAESTCMGMNGALPVIKSRPELIEIQDIIKKNQPSANYRSIWLNVQWNGVQFVWIPDGTPVDLTIVPIIDAQTCSTACCRLLYNQQEGYASVVPCSNGWTAGLLCVKPFGSQLQSSLKATQAKANALEKENQDLRQDVNSLKSGRIAAFVLVGLLVVTVIILVAGFVSFYKKIKSFQN